LSIPYTKLIVTLQSATWSKSAKLAATDKKNLSKILKVQKYLFQLTMESQFLYEWWLYVGGQIQLVNVIYIKCMTIV